MKSMRMEGPGVASSGGEIVRCGMGRRDPDKRGFAFVLRSVGLRRAASESDMPVSSSSLISGTDGARHTRNGDEVGLEGYCFGGGRCARGSLGEGGGGEPGSIFIAALTAWNWAAI